jgi:molybdopterin converting factor small subunit
MVTIECYGAVRAATERKAIEVELADGATVGDALAALAEEYSGFECCRRKELVVMRDSTHVEETDAVADGDVLSVSNPPMVED